MLQLCRGCSGRVFGMERESSRRVEVNNLEVGQNLTNFDYIMAGVEGLEPPTLGLEIRCSILLSYTPTLISIIAARSAPSQTARSKAFGPLPHDGDIGVSDGIRTRDVQIHSLALYQAELRSPQGVIPM
jgi:hypothetical protein